MRMIQTQSSKENQKWIFLSKISTFMDIFLRLEKWLIFSSIYLRMHEQWNSFEFCRSMSNERRQLFVGVIENEKWTEEKLKAYLTRHACMNDDQYITDCQFMSYNEARFQGKIACWYFGKLVFLFAMKLGKSFAFVTFTDAVCVDRCMEKRSQLNEEYGLTLKRLLPDALAKCQRLVSTPDIVIRIALPGRFFLFTSHRMNSRILIRSFVYGTQHSFVFECLWNNPRFQNARRR